jgi:proton-dependent oligopeptide transporter, POT family
VSELQKSTFLGYPKGLFLIAGTEFWDRFSYYGMMGLLVLFLSDTVANGGFGWQQPDALRLYGIYTACIYFTPVLGGWIVSRFLGERRSLASGGILIVLGHLLLGASAYWSITNVWVIYSFYGGLTLIMLGTGLLKPAISSIIGGLYAPNDPRKDSAYTIFLVSIFLGGFVANFIAGTLGEKLGWHAGLAAAGFGMLLGLLFYFYKQDVWLGDVGKECLYHTQARRVTRLTTQEKSRITVLVIIGCAAVVYAVLFYQKGGMLHLLAKQNTDRVIAGFEIPATWLLSISTGLFIIFAPFSDKLWNWAERHHFKLDLPTKLAIGLALLTAGYIFQICGLYERQASATATSSVVWLIATYLCFGCGDIFFWPASFAAVSRLAPEGKASLAFGIYYVVFGIGTWLSAEVGVLSYKFDQGVIFMGLLVLGSSAAVLLYLLRPFLNRAAQ